MRAGNLDRRIVIQTSTDTPDASGQPVPTWSTFKTVWAARRDVRGTERFTAKQELAVRTATFRLRWITGVNERMRIVDDGTTWDILGIADYERQGFMEISCEAQNPASTGG